VGFKLKEYAVPVDKRLFIFAEANDRNDELSLSKPLKEGYIYLSSLSKIEFMQTTQDNLKTNRYIMPILLAVGIALVVWGWG